MAPLPWHWRIDVGTLVYSVGIIIPIGAIFITIFVELGGLEFVGTPRTTSDEAAIQSSGPGRTRQFSILGRVLQRRPLRHPKRLRTRRLPQARRIHHRDLLLHRQYRFSSASSPQTLEMLSLFPVIFAAYFFCVVVTATILVRVPPISRVSEEYIEEPDPELAFSGSPSDYFRLAVSEGCRKGKGRRNVPAGRNSRVRRRTETDESHPGHYSRGRPGCDAAVGQHAGVPDTRRTTDPDNLRPGHPQR